MAKLKLGGNRRRPSNCPQPFTRRWAAKPVGYFRDRKGVVRMLARFMAADRVFGKLRRAARRRP